MSKGLNPNAVQEVLKLASLRLKEQKAIIEQQEAKLAAYAIYEVAEKLADKMIDQGHLDYSDREEKIAQLMANPERMDVINEASDMASNPNNFKLANLTDQLSASGAGRQKFESYLLSGE